MSEVLIVQKYTVAFYSLTKNHTLVDHAMFITNSQISAHLQGDQCHSLCKGDRAEMFCCISCQYEWTTWGLNCAVVVLEISIGAA